MSTMNYVIHLDEVGDPLLRQLEEIKDIERRVSELKRQIREKESELAKEVRELWTQGERNLARQRYLTELSKPK